MILAKGRLKATKLIRYIKFTHKSVSAENFKFEDIFGSATTVILAINCIINCDIAAIINVNLFFSRLKILSL